MAIQRRTVGRCSLARIVGDYLSGADACRGAIHTKKTRTRPKVVTIDQPKREELKCGSPAVLKCFITTSHADEGAWQQTAQPSVRGTLRTAMCVVALFMVVTSWSACGRTGASGRWLGASFEMSRHSKRVASSDSCETAIYFREVKAEPGSLHLHSGMPHFAIKGRRSAALKHDQNGKPCVLAR